MGLLLKLDVVTINNPPAVTADPSDDNICEGDNTSFAVTATGTGSNVSMAII